MIYKVYMLHLLHGGRAPKPLAIEIQNYAELISPLSVSDRSIPAYKQL